MTTEPTTVTTFEPPRKAGGEGLQRMFSAVPRRYDLLNRILTLGLDQRWRRRAVRACLAENPGRVLDLCSGTGDLAVMLAAAAKPGVSIVAADFAAPMLEAARRKAEQQEVAERIELRAADAAALPFADGEFDAVGIAFGFRNLTWKNPAGDRHLAEVHRVLARGGRFVVVETSRPPSALLRAGSDAWYAAVVGPLGGLVSGESGAYRYLSRSARGFLRAEEVDELLLGAGFSAVEHQRLLGGIAALHVATR
jgi:demethylmenaquinone methyltransferase/2-methoxy-6-polyprenyl-1,4-benzoquinol methylase